MTRIKEYLKNKIIGIYLNEDIYKDMILIKNQFKLTYDDILSQGVALCGELDSVSIDDLLYKFGFPYTDKDSRVITIRISEDEYEILDNLKSTKGAKLNNSKIFKVGLSYYADKYFNRK